MLTKEVKINVAHDRDSWLRSDLECDASPQAAWAKARLLLGNNKSAGPRLIQVAKDKYESNPAKMASMFSDHYINKSERLREQRVREPKINPVTRPKSWLRDHPPIPSFSFHSIDQYKLTKLINKLKPGKALPMDGIDGRSFKLVAPLLIPAILHIVNLSLTKNMFAEDYKVQLINPHHKKLEKDNIDNYGPVSSIVSLRKRSEGKK